MHTSNGWWAKDCGHQTADASVYTQGVFLRVDTLVTTEITRSLPRLSRVYSYCLGQLYGIHT